MLSDIPLVKFQKYYTNIMNIFHGISRTFLLKFITYPQHFLIVKQTHMFFHVPWQFQEIVSSLKKEDLYQK